MTLPIESSLAPSSTAVTPVGLPTMPILEDRLSIRALFPTSITARIRDLTASSDFGLSATPSFLPTIQQPSVPRLAPSQSSPDASSSWPAMPPLARSSPFLSSRTVTRQQVLRRFTPKAPDAVSSPAPSRAELDARRDWENTLATQELSALAEISAAPIARGQASALPKTIREPLDTLVTEVVESDDDVP